MNILSLRSMRLFVLLATLHFSTPVRAELKETAALSAHTEWDGENLYAVIQTAGAGGTSGQEAQVELRLDVSEEAIYRTVSLNFVELRPAEDEMVEQILVSHCYRLNVRELLASLLPSAPFKPLLIHLPDTSLNMSMIPPKVACSDNNTRTTVPAKVRP